MVELGVTSHSHTSHPTSHSTTPHCRSTSAPPTRELGRDEVIKLVAWLAAELGGRPFDESSMPAWLHVLSLDEAILLIASDMQDVMTGVAVPRRFVLINDGVSGTRGGHWFPLVYEVT
jgi:hypothetical protein